MSAEDSGDKKKAYEESVPPKVKKESSASHQTDPKGVQEQQSPELPGSLQWQEPLALLADLAADQSLALAQQRLTPSETLTETSRILANWGSEQSNIPSTSGWTLSHPYSSDPIEGDIIDPDLLQKFAEFDEAAFEVASSVGSLSIDGASPPDTAPLSKYSRPDYLPETISSSSEYYSSSSSSRHSPLVPATIDCVEEEKSVTKPEVLLGNTSFWKYRRTPKGPEGLTFEPQLVPPTDPTKPLEFRDPAFVKSTTTARLSHFGKARIGEGNDTTPDPEKLAKLGCRIKDLGQQIAAITEERHNKEKVKLSSSQGRLRKIANNEANKIIFNGMESEKSELTRTISEVKAAIQSHEEGSARASSATDSELNESLVGKINNIISQIYQTKVAGQAGVYIDNILADYGYISD